MIVLIAAVPMETELLRRKLSPCEVRSCGRREMYQGPLGGTPVALVHCGIGKTNAAAGTAAVLDKLLPRAVINFGCCGAYPGSGLRIGDLILASEEVFGDEGVVTPEGFQDMKAIGIPLVQIQGRRFFNRYPVDSALMAKARPVVEGFAQANGRRLAVGAMVTVSSCSGTDQLGLELARRTGGIGENMEGAAIAQVCALYQTPFFEIRGISNLVETRDLRHWDLREGAETAQRAIHALLAEWQEPRSIA